MGLSALSRVSAGFRKPSPHKSTPENSSSQDSASTTTAHSVTVQKGYRAIKIFYNEGIDLYDVTTFTMKKNVQGLTDVIKETTEGLYWEDLKTFIERFFRRFQYVMDGITRHKVSA
jgi:hypothetical protein